MEPFYPHAALGYRIWELGPEGALRSYSKNYVWQRGMNESVCVAPGSGHEVPGENCGCGFNAYHDLRSALGAARMNEAALGHRYVCGAVAGRGRVQVHHTGWRAEQSWIIGILAEGNQRYRGDSLYQRYGAPVFGDHAMLVSYAERIACAVPEQERPEAPLSPAQIEVLRRDFSNVPALELAENLGVALHAIYELADLYIFDERIEL